MTSRLDRMLNYVGVLASVGLFFAVALAALTMWVIGQSRERTECYKTAAFLECAQPGVVERALRKILGHNGIN